MDLISTEQLKRALAIREQIESLENDLEAILGTSGGTSSSRKGPRTMSASARRKIAAAQKARWAKVGATGTKKHQRTKMPAAAKAKLAAIARARWKKAKAAGKTRL